MTDIMTRAKPDAAALKEARRLIASEAELRGLFEVAPESVEWLADNLAVRLSARGGGKDFGIAWEVALYLADEFFQTKSTPVTVTDKETGNVVARLPEDAVWQPAPVARQSGNLVQPPPRLRPDIEAALVVGQHDRAREQLAVRSEGYQNASERQKAILTVDGRGQAASRAFEAALRAFPQAAQRLPIELGTGLVQKTLVAQTALRMPDLQSMNLRFDLDQWLERVLVRHWCNAVAALIVEAASVAGPGDTDADFWIGNPDQLRWALQGRPRPHWVFGDKLVGVHGTTFSMSFPETPTEWCAITTHMTHDAWEVVAQVPVMVSRLSSHIWVEEAPVQTEHRAEIVR
jgi:hypothetical protein